MTRAAVNSEVVLCGSDYIDYKMMDDGSWISHYQMTIHSLKTVLQVHVCTCTKTVLRPRTIRNGLHIQT
jgi:hypothetical protein